MAKLDFTAAELDIEINRGAKKSFDVIVYDSVDGVETLKDLTGMTAYHTCNEGKTDSSVQVFQNTYTGMGADGVIPIVINNADTETTVGGAKYYHDITLDIGTDEPVVLHYGKFTIKPSFTP
jgi:uncharacterized protein YbjQ (UPF0145 family)